ncbi:MAG: hypothetical protein P1P87_04945 [Trueperaceae bacterium]|nr:hypothetical protein [Trueperaceae bacterium]
MTVLRSADMTDPQDREADSIYATIAQRLPGVRLVSRIQGWAYLDEFERGIAEYHKLISPSPDDERWLGVCYFKTLDDEKALEHFYRAVQGGATAARVNLAHLLRFLDRGEETARELDAVDPRQLSRYDQVLYFRVKSIHEETNGNIRLAMSFGEEAWRLVQGIPEFDILAPSVLAQLGVLFGRYGRAQRALWHLERGIQITSGVEQLKVRLKRALVLTTLGRYLEARAELDTVPQASAAAGLAAERLLLLGDVAWSLNELPKATRYYLASIREAERGEVSYEEFLCRLPLASIHAYGRDFETSEEHLSHAQRLISDKADRLNFRFREILLNRWRRSYSPGHALSELESLAQSFNEMGLLQEMGWVRLHCADIERELALDYVQTLNELQALSVTLQNHAFLAREWSTLPELRGLATKSHPLLAGGSSAILELHTLGEERIVLAGDTVRVPLRKAPEVLAYFLEHKAVSLDQLLTDIFPDEKPRSAKSYFHQVRHQLKEHVEGLEIEFDREAKLYRLKSEVDILWDVAEMRAGRRVAKMGPFLPGSGNDWALMLDHALERYRTDEP